MRIKTLAPLAVLFVGLTAFGCADSDDAGAMDDEIMEEPAMQDGMNDGMNDEMMSDTMMADSVHSDSAMMEYEDGAMEMEE
jgi:hypothetical protein